VSPRLHRGERARVAYRLPLAEIVLDFYDRLKSVSRGYASLDYEFDGYREADVVKLDVLLNNEPVDALSCHRPPRAGVRLGPRPVREAQGADPKQMFQVAIQARSAARSSRARRLGAIRKNVTAKCYGGDITRKRKLLEKQKEGKRRMKQIGTVEGAAGSIPGRAQGGAIVRATRDRRGEMATRTTRQKSTVVEYIEAILWALVLTLFLRAFVIQAFRIPSESMVPTLLVGDFLFVNKFEYGAKIRSPHSPAGLRAPRRGDVIVFQWPVNPSKDFIKRCIATGGQTVEVRDKQVIVDGDTLKEPYAVHHRSRRASAGYDVRDTFGPYTVRPGELFMMGDNRDNSNDSRFWGPVSMDLVKGRAMFIYSRQRARTCGTS
jgi:signal peptidase I